MHGTIWRYGWVAGSPDDLTRAGHELDAVPGRAPGFPDLTLLTAR